MPERLTAILTAAHEIFGREVGPGDNFFAAGGDSLIAAELAAMLEERFGLDVPLDAVLRTPDFETLASAVHCVGDGGLP